MNHMKTFRGRLTSFLVHEKFQVAVETLDETSGKQSLTSISKEHFRTKSSPCGTNKSA